MIANQYANGIGRIAEITDSTEFILIRLNKPLY
jgi:hypothetical protein